MERRLNYTPAYLLVVLMWFLACYGWAQVLMWAVPEYAHMGTYPLVQVGLIMLQRNQHLPMRRNHQHA